MPIIKHARHPQVSDQELDALIISNAHSLTWLPPSCPPEQNLFKRLGEVSQGRAGRGNEVDDAAAASIDLGSPGL